MSEVTDYLSQGVAVANDKADLTEMFKDWPLDRIVILHICTPHPEVASYVENWIQHFADGHMQEGSVSSEMFSLWLDTTGDKYQFGTALSMMPEATTQIWVPETTFWDLAGRSDSIYTAYITGKPFVIRSAENYALRDIAHMDLILTTIHEALLNSGTNLAQLAR
jgi:hypothetical protein